MLGEGLRPCRSEGSALSTQYTFYHKVNVTQIVYCWHLKYVLYVDVLKCKVCCIEFVPKYMVIY